MDGYNWGTDPAGHALGWQTFDEVFHQAYQAILAIAPTKPMMIGEVGSVELGGSKAGWITDMLSTQLPNNYPQVKAVAYFDENMGDGNWPLESSTTSEQAWTAGIQSSHYVSNQFGSADTSPIPPP